MDEGLKNKANRNPKLSMTTNRQKVFLGHKQMVFKASNLTQVKGSPLLS